MEAVSMEFCSSTPWGVEDGDADLAILVYVGVPEAGVDNERGWAVGIVLGEFESGLVAAAFVQRSRGAEEVDGPLHKVVWYDGEASHTVLVEVLELLLDMSLGRG
jgi:hypothetical protein